MSPTSWTRDEDFDLLLDAVRRCDAAGRRAARISRRARAPHRPRPPARALRSRALAALPARRLHVRTAWLEPDDYPARAGRRRPGPVPAPLGVGARPADEDRRPARRGRAGVRARLRPVPGRDPPSRGDRPALRRRRDARAASGSTLLRRRSPRATPHLDRLRANVEKSRGATWREGWDAEARPVLLGCMIDWRARVRRWWPLAALALLGFVVRTGAPLRQGLRRRRRELPGQRRLVPHAPDRQPHPQLPASLAPSIPTSPPTRRWSRSRCCSTCSSPGVAWVIGLGAPSARTIEVVGRPGAADPGRAHRRGGRASRRAAVRSPHGLAGRGPPGHRARPVPGPLRGSASPITTWPRRC